MRSVFISFLLVAGSLSASSGCDGPTPSARSRDGKPAYDTAPIDAAALHTDSKLRRHVLYMPFGEAAARLGSLHFDARSSMVFSRGNQELEQNDLYSVTQDSLGNFHVVLRTPSSEVETYLVGETLYVRHDEGRLRHKPRRDIEAAPWCELAYSSTHQALEVFQPRLLLTEGRPESLGGRQVVRYGLALSGADPPSPAERDESLPPTTLPVAPPARWRELARPLDLRGSLAVDTASGVLLQISLEGRVEIADRQVRPTQLLLRYDAEVKETGRVASIKPPAGIEEYRRVPAPKDLLGFFREHLPKEPEPSK